MKAPEHLLDQLKRKSVFLRTRLRKQTAKYLDKFERYEHFISNTITKVDAIASYKLLTEGSKTYAELREKLNTKSSPMAYLGGRYFPHLDSLQTIARFFMLEQDLNSDSSSKKNKALLAMEEMNSLQCLFDKAEYIDRYLIEKSGKVDELLKKYNLDKSIKPFKKDLYHYQGQVEEIKRVFKEPSHLEKKALQVLTDSPKFRDFFQKHSQLAQFFKQPGDQRLLTQNALKGMQTRQTVIEDIKSRFGSTDKMQDMLRGQAPDAQMYLSRLKNEVANFGGTSSDIIMPNFKPNSQRTKYFWQRLEIQTNIQSAKANYFYPRTTDVGLSVGYKVSDNSVIGIGASSKFGWGQNVQHICISHDGVGLRSFVDYKLKGNFWLAGGAELNYNGSLKHFEIFKDYNRWYKSALLGISKKYKAGHKVKGNVQLLYDFLWNQEIIKTKPLLFRVGYSLK